MKNRTGQECKKINCVYHVTYVNWAKNLGNSFLENCMNCRHAHVSQYKNQFKLQETIDKRNKMKMAKIILNIGWFLSGLFSIWWFRDYPAASILTLVYTAISLISLVFIIGRDNKNA